MKKIVETNLDDQRISLHPLDDIESIQNSFTIIIGSNNSGKSRLLKKIIQISSDENYSFDKIIGFSTAHFNKLPTPFKINENYIKFSTNPADFIFGQDKYSKDLDKYEKIIDDYIKNNEVDFFLKNNISSLHINQLFEIFISSNKDQVQKYNDWKIISKFLNLPESIEFKVTQSSHFKKLKKYLEDNKNTSSQKLDKLVNNKTYNFSLQEMFALDKKIIELLQLRLLSITKIAYQHESKSLPLTSLSSGQLSILTLGLALISSIQNNSLICIDEPELNLHPEWQTEIIKLIELLSKKYTGCQFFIATHSPQIISNINSENSYILNLNQNTLTISTKFKDKSSDFQLSQAFNFPGNNNEFLIRKLIIILNKLNTEEDFILDNESKELLQHISLLLKGQKIDQEDKVKILFNLVESYRG